MEKGNQRRLLLLLKLLYERTDEDHAVSGPDILRYWEAHGIQVNRKTVYSDIRSLVEFGVDIVCVRSAQNHYFIGSRLFELPELKLLVSAVESSQVITERKSEVLIQKLGRLTSVFLAEQLASPPYTDGIQKPHNESVYYVADEIQTAIHNRRPISFQYYEYTKGKERILKHNGYRYVVSPFALIWHRDFYYVVGWSEKHGKLAQFRVDRITAVQKADGPYREASHFDPAAYLREVFGMYHDDARQVTLLCENPSMRSIIDRFGEGVETEPVDASHFRATVHVAPSPPFFAWVFTFGGAIRIEGPQDILERMRQMAKWLEEEPPGTAAYAPDRT